MTTATVLTKVCTKCGIKKPIEEFSTHREGRYWRSWCKWCCAQYSRNYYTERSAENVKLYGTATLPDRLEKIKERSMGQAIENRKLYGTACSPKWLKKNRERIVVTRAKWRMQALALLGSRCECCGEDRPERLTFDHIYGGEYKTRTTGNKTVREILTMENPASKYRILCWNCNMSLGAYGYCPHNGRPPEEEPASSTKEPAKYGRQLNRRRGLETFAEYGGKCVICGEENWEFLCIDHINGGGNQHRKELGKYSGRFYLWLKSQGYPKDEYRLLCHNCNEAKGMVKTGGEV